MALDPPYTIRALEPHADDPGYPEVLIWPRAMDSARARFENIFGFMLSYEQTELIVAAYLGALTSIHEDLFEGETYVRDREPDEPKKVARYMMDRMIK